MTGISRRDAPVAVEASGVELRVREIGGEMSAGFVRLAAGTDLRPVLKGLPEDLCQCPHWGYLLSGSLKMHTPDGAYVYHAGESFYWPPGHAPQALEDCEYVDFSPTKEFAEVLDHVSAAG